MLEKAEFSANVRIVCYWAAGCLLFDFVTAWRDLPWLVQVLRVAIGLGVCRFMFLLGWQALGLYPTWPRPWGGLALGVLLGNYAFMLTLGAHL